MIEYSSTIIWLYNHNGLYTFSSETDHSFLHIFILFVHMFTGDILTVVYLAITFVISITVHEFAHARTSDRLGDPTPRMQWRLTLNPLSHVDPIWFLMIFIIQFWWGRAVQVNTSYYKNKLRDELLVAVAWPVSNIILACFWICFMHLYASLLWISPFSWLWDPVLWFWRLFAIVNCWLAVFNMIPIPPLDWYRVISYLRPATAYTLQKYSQYFWLVLLALIFLPDLIPGLPHPLWFVTTISQTIFWLLNSLFSLLFFW